MSHSPSPKRKPPPSPVRVHDSHPVAIPGNVNNPGPGAYTIKDGFDQNLMILDRYQFQVRKRQQREKELQSHSSTKTKKTELSSFAAEAQSPAGMRAGFSMGGKTTYNGYVSGCDSPGPMYDCSKAEKSQRLPVLGGSIGKSLRFEQDRRQQRKEAELARLEKREALRQQQQGTNRTKLIGEGVKSVQASSLIKRPTSRTTSPVAVTLSKTAPTKSSLVLDERSYTPNIDASSTFRRSKGVAFRPPHMKETKRLQLKDHQRSAGASSSAAANNHSRGHAWREKIRREEMRLKEEGLVNDEVVVIEGEAKGNQKGQATSKEVVPKFDFGCSGDSHFRGDCSFGTRPKQRTARTPGPGEYDLLNDRPPNSSSKSYRYMDGPSRATFFRGSTTLPTAPALQPNEEARRANTPAALLYLSG